MDSDAKILICTHATLRFAYETIEETKFNDCLLAIDEFHHVSADLDSSKLGELLHSIMTKQLIRLRLMMVMATKYLN